MATLFDPIRLGDIELANRIAMAPLTRNRSPNAIPQAMAATYYAQRATAGLLISEGTAISHQAQGYADVPGLYKPESIESWKKVTKAVHDKGGRIVTQLWHVGAISHTSLQPNGGQPVSPSGIAAKSKTYVINADGSGAFVETSEPRALELAEIPGLIEDYRKAARAAIEAGFDGVEIHAANGYLLQQFMSTGSNTRTDQYGGSAENRIRLTLEVVDAITKEIGGGRTGIRLSPVTPANNNSDTNPQESYTLLVEKLAAYDLAFIHVVEGATGGPRDQTMGDKPFDWEAFKAAYRHAGGKGGWIVNNGYSRDMAMDAVESGKADVVAFGKAFIANPDLVRRLKENAPLNAGDQSTFYGGGEKGYTDYPTLD
ncbi:alkene reductase [Allorhizobium sp. BGMRC 0089]|uniref:alkene reductase n=1 Tax=Allorhizobium sonneratiae TaxID=2934936 RepID=UPI0020344AF3|nr:alkene reductase [Allorhizobium sonneratiae]MCM2291253.1 alkene reductase [Allorhizobium sonneratiae]